MLSSCQNDNSVLCLLFFAYLPINLSEGVENKFFCYCFLIPSTKFSRRCRNKFCAYCFSSHSQVTAQAARATVERTELEELKEKFSEMNKTYAEMFESIEPDPVTSAALKKHRLILLPDDNE